MAVSAENLAAMYNNLATGVSGFPEETIHIGGIEGYTDINAGWTLQSGYLVFFMQIGFAMLCAGAVRAKNAKNIILLNLLDACFGSVAWYLTGWAFAYGDPTANEDGVYTFSASQAFIGNRYFVQNGLARTSYVSWFFQFTFAATAATIVSGAVAERCRFEAYMMYEFMLVMFVYPVVAHWVWSPFGWASALRSPATSKTSWTLLANSGVYDFAGDGPVHMVGGFASLAGAWVLGPRLGRFDASGNPIPMPGHSAALNVLGVFFLWFGWYGFNPGSTNAIVGATGFSKVAAAVAVNTTLGAALGAISTLFTVMLHTYFTTGVVVWDLVIAGNGALAGLVGITGPCAFVQTWAAIIIGMIAGPVMYAASLINLHLLKVDDPLDAIAVHAGAGIWGLIASAAFADQGMVEEVYGTHPVTDGPRNYGFIMGGNGAVLGAHLLFILAVTGWTLGLMTPFFMLIKRVGLFRVPPEWEVQGLDVSLHAGSAYPHDLPGPGKGGEPKAYQQHANPLADAELDARVEAAMARLAGRNGAGAGDVTKQA
ncbi:AMT1A [Auxenochlorella protothecoides x Auxenochlorella symbiontica]|uniref:Ammonium transporter n=1 Tax=Auxenochlorella protothecoides TaxID=3075 RepID=A0A087SFZ7_AUXPR|nr:Ammonium transporter 1 member 1 [Auxenochlorella protothecoides]KFM24651.1 Ammonium transporter 1 member 1 [Auxenochlorella protothecoides]